MDMMKRKLSLVLAILMLFSVFPILGFDRVKAEEDWDYVETFDESTLTGTSYKNWTFPGVHGNNWTATGARPEDQHPIKGKGILLGNKTADQSSLSTTIENGVGAISIDLKKEYGNSKKRTIGIYVGDETKARASIDVPTNNFETKTLTATLNENGPVDITIKHTDPKSSRAQVTIDNVKWTNYSDGTSSIAKVRAMAKGKEVTTKGIVTFFDHNTVVIQDQSAGIAIYNKADLENAVGTLALGDQIQLTGTIGEFNNLLQLQNVKEVTKLSTDNKLPEPKEMTIADIHRDGENCESQRVLIKDARLDSINPDENTTISQGDDTINIYKASDLADFKAGDQVDLVAVVSQFRDNYQLRVAQASDITKTGEGEPITPIDPTEDPGVTPILEAKQAKNTVTTAGSVTFVDGKSITIQDNTAGIVVRLKDFDENIEVGDYLKATGKIGNFKGLTQLNESSYEVEKGKGASIEPEPVSIKELKTAEDFKLKYESKKIKLKEVTLGEINTGGNTTIRQDKESINIYRIPELTGIDDFDIVDVIGIASIYNNKQIRVAKAKDVTLVTEGEVPEVPEYTGEDPLSEEKIKAKGAKNIKEALALTPENQDEKERVKVMGVVSQIYEGGQKMTIQDVIDNHIYGLLIYGPTETAKEGDIVVVDANMVNFYGLPELSNVNNMEIVGETTPFKPQEVNFRHVTSLYRDYINEYVLIKDVTLPEYNSDGTIEFRDSSGSMNSYRAKAYPMGAKAGDIVDIYGVVNAHNGVGQIDVVQYVIKNDKINPVVEVGNFQNARAGIDYNFQVKAHDNVGVKSVIGKFQLIGSDDSKTPLNIQLDYDEVKNIWTGTIPGEKLYGIESIILDFLATDDNNLKSNGLHDAPFTYGDSPRAEALTIAVEDLPVIKKVSPAPNEETKENKSPLIKAELINAGDNPTVTLNLNGNNYTMDVKNNIASFQAENLNDGKVNAMIKVIRQDGKETEYEWNFYIGEADFKHYYGQIHSHTNYSDGAGTPEQAVQYASQAEQIDFFAITDHSNYFDNKSNLGTFDNADSGKRDPLKSSMSKWQVYKDTILSHRTKDFLPIYGFEMTWTKSGANYGHINTYNTEGFVSRNDPKLNDKTSSAGLLRYYEELTQLKNSFSQWNHPGYTFGTFDDFGHYDPRYDAELQLVEVGNGEGPVGGEGYWRSYDYYTMALDNGWHVSPSNNQDNHKGKWGDANTARNVMIADELSLDGLLNAVDNHRWYSTEDNNLQIDYTVNDKLMGSKLELANTANLDIKVDISDPDIDDVIGNVELISNGGAVKASEEINSNSGNIKWAVPNDGSYYYVRVTQGDGDIAVTAPVWTKKVAITGIDSVTKNTQVETLGKETELKTSFNNQSEADIKLSKIEYIVEGSQEPLLVVTEDLPILVAGEKTEFSHNIIPTAMGKQTLQVKIYPADGQTVYSKSLDMNVYPSDLEVSPISNVHKAEEGEPFIIEGRLTSNASGFDPNTAFFDSAYVQDESSGINIFPIANDFEEGTKVRIIGKKSSYQGEGQLNVDSIEKIDESIEKIAPTVLTTGDVPNHLGRLVKVSGKVKEVKYVEDVISQILIDDNSGPIRVFIDGYIGRLNSGNKSMEEISQGDTIEAIGLSSIDTEGNRIRVRNRDDITILENDTPDKPDEPITPDEPDTPDKPDEPDVPDTPTIPVKEIQLNKSVLVLKKGMSEKLSFTIKPEDATNKKVVWKSSNNSVATVDENGKVMAIGKGLATIVIESESGHVDAYCTVQVTDSKDKPYDWHKPNKPNRRPSRPTTNDETVDDETVDIVKPHEFTVEIKDIDDHWAEEVIREIVERGLMDLDDGMFFPNAPTTRIDVIKALAIYENINPKDYIGDSLSDIDNTSIESGYVNWAMEKGIINGYEDGTFRALRTISREEMAKVLNEYVENLEKDFPIKDSVEFKDEEEIGDWAEPYVKKATERGLLKGRETGEFDPKDDLKRGEVAQIVFNIILNIEK